MLPTFIIPGAGKSGTTALWAYLNEHPKVCMARMKEPMFFTRTRERLSGGEKINPMPGRYDRGLAWYENLFAHCGNAKVRGEASTAYLRSPDSAGLIKAVVPDIRLIFILRDPVSRLYSSYWQHRKSGWKLPDFKSMMRSNHPRFQWFCYASSYKLHLERFLAIFPRNQILVLLHEALKENPLPTIQTAYQFIGVAPDYVPPSLEVQFNESALPKWPWLERVIRRSSRTRIALKLPDGFRSRLSALRRLVSDFNRIPIKYPPMPKELRLELVERFEEDIAFVEQLLDTNLASWRQP